MKDKRIHGILSALGCEALFGLSYVITKGATEIAHPIALLSWRFLASFLFMILLLAFGVIKVELKGKKLKPLLLISLFNPSIYFLSETVGISLTSATESGVFLASIPVFSLLASTVILKKRLLRSEILGISITLIGVILTVLAMNASATFSPLGYTLLLVAVASYALYSVYVEKVGDYSEVEITFFMMASGALLFTILFLISGIASGDLKTMLTLPFQDLSFLLAVLYQGIACSVIAFFLSNFAISRIGVNRSSSFIGISTVVSIIAGVLFLKENFSSIQIAGAIIILIGVYTANLK